MDRKLIAMLLVASSFASSAFATSIVNKLITKHHSATASMTKAHKTTKQANTSYVDFSGSWVGNCGDNEPFTTVIENDFSYITLDGEESIIGAGLQGKYQSNEVGNQYSHSSFEWNKDGSALTMKGVDVMKDNADNSAIETMLSTFTLTMKNGRINLDGKVAGLEDLNEVQEPITIHCVFNKKQ